MARPFFYFGYPAAHEDDAQRAVRAALGILAALEALNGRLKREKGAEPGPRWSGARNPPPLPGGFRARL